MARAVKKSDDHNPNAEHGHNSAAEEEASRVQFLSILSQYDGALGEVEVARAPLKAAQKKVSSIVGLAKAAGIPKWRLEARHDEMNRPPHENADNIIAEARERRWAGIISPEQLRMYEEKTAPEEVMDASDWSSRGYKIGVLGRAADLPDGMPSRFTQDFMGGYDDGRKSYMLTLAKNAPKPKGAKAKDIAADAESKVDEMPEVDIEGAAKALKNSDFMKTGAPDAEFEMTDEEREAQKLRPSVQENEEPVL